MLMKQDRRGKEAEEDIKLGFAKKYLMQVRKFLPQ